MTPNHVLLVAPTSDLADAAVHCLLMEAPKVKVVRDFDAAKTELELEPAAMLVTELKLGAYNGLHLAIRAGATQTPVIVLGIQDPVLESVARENGIEYLRAPHEFDKLQSFAHSVMAASAEASSQTLKEVPQNEPMAPWPAPAAEEPKNPTSSRHAFVA